MNHIRIESSNCNTPDNMVDMGIIGVSEAIKLAKSIALSLAPGSSVSVVYLGETVARFYVGTGFVIALKEVYRTR